MAEKRATDTCEPIVASEPTVHRTCAQTHRDLSMRDVDNALNALNALGGRGQGHFRLYFLGDELLALLCTLEMYVPHMDR